ncbi:MAG: hypothetical protein KatS3mg113_0885 [Planctomycetaceae bacterium]|nr:MAG: hypothetical protein KatS3mg113_0885 [Planctomycetaceae bacterium]
MIDTVLAAILIGVAYLSSSDGAWNAGVNFLCALLAGLLAMNFFEPLAIFLTRIVPEWGSRWDMICLLGLFAGFVYLLRLLSEQLAPVYIPVSALIEQLGRWLFAGLTGYLTMAIVLTALHTTPLPREFWGFRPERANLFNLAAPDRQWLGFVQYVTEHALARYDLNVGYRNGRPVPHAFDGTFFQLGEPQQPYPNDIWPSFPIRYATRREVLSGGMVMTSNAGLPGGGGSAPATSPSISPPSVTPNTPPPTSVSF